MSELEEKFAAALQSASRSWRQAVDRRLRPLKLSQASWLTLATVAQAKRPPSQKEVADTLGVECPTMGAMLDRMVKLGLLARVRSLDDRRVNRVGLTQAGHKLHKIAFHATVGVRTELLARIDLKELLVATEVLELLRVDLESADSASRAQDAMSS